MPTPSPSIPDQIRAILAESTKRAKSASRGLHVEGSNTIYDSHGCSVADFAYSDLCTDDDEANAKFFAAASTDLPARDAAILIAVEALADSAVHYAPTAGQVALAAILATLNGETK